MTIRRVIRLILIGCVAVGSATPTAVRAQRGLFFPVYYPRQENATRAPLASRRDVRLYRTAVKRLEDGRPEEAVVYFQSILDSDVDGFFEVDDSGRLASLRGETVRRLESLAGEAKQAYTLRYEPAANGQLADAVASGDEAKLAQVARRYPSTAAGRDASYRLALHHIDRGELLAAVTRLERLRQDPETAARAALLVHLANCYQRLDAETKLGNVLQELAELDGEISLAGRRVEVANDRALRAAFDRVDRSVPQVAASDWPVAGGGVDRSNYRTDAATQTEEAIEWSADGLVDPFLEQPATQSSLQTQLHRWAAQTALIELAGGWPAAPAARPIVVEGTVYFRTPFRLVALDGRTGRRRWRSFADPFCWDYLTHSTWESPEGEVAGRTVVGQRLWSDATWGVPASDGQVVFAVEESGAATPLPTVQDAARPPAAKGPIVPATFNRLVAYEAATGRRLWEAGGPPGRDTPLAGTFFYGVPVPVGGNWFALGEIAGVTHLIALSPDRPDGILWTRPIAEHDETVDHDVIRRTGGHSPCVAGGLLVCPVGSNYVVAVDPATRSLLWAWKPAEPDRSDDSRGRWGSGWPIDRSHSALEVIAAGSRLLIASPTSGVSAVDALDGTVQWNSTEFAGVWLVGVDDEAVYLQTPTGIAALQLSDGAPAWSAAAVIGPPSGRGVVVGRRLCIPLADATLVMLDATTGRVLTRHPAPEHEPLGNLVVVGGTLISQSATRLVAFPLPP